MSFNIPRDSNNKIIKTSKTINAIPVLDQAISIGSTGNTQFASINTLTFNNTLVTSSATQLNAVDVTPGTALPSKALVLNSSSDITGINNLSCNSLIVNGVNITSDMFASATSDDAANPYMTNIIPGIAQPSKALICNSSASISNINSLSTKLLNINNTSITNISKNININNLYNSRQTSYRQINGYFISRMTLNATDNTYIQNTYWQSVCWSSALSLYVAVCNGSLFGNTDTRRIMTSSNGVTWSLQIIPSNSNLHSICWSSQLGIFVAVGDIIITSSNGINWTSRTLLLPGTIRSICWTDELSLFVAVTSNGTNNRVITSSDGITWKIRFTPGDCSLMSICWSPELSLFVAVGSGGTSDRTLISSNGINWTLGSCLLNSYTWSSVCWSPERMLFVAVSGQAPGIMYSTNGYRWYLNSSYVNFVYSPTCICWAKDIEAFIAIDSNGNSCNILYSNDGYTWWRGNSISDNNGYGCVIWNSDYQQLLAVSNSSQYGNTCARVGISNPLIMSTKNNIIGNKITFSKVNNNIGINSTTPNKLLEINSITGNCFKYFNNTNNARFISFDVLNTGQLNITTQNYFAIQSDNSTFGLMLNNTLITTRPSEFNTLLTNNTLGIAQKSKPIIVDSNINISGINLLTCNYIIENGVNLTIASNNQYFINATQGTAVTSSALIANSNNNISNINNISTNNLNINNSKISLYDSSNLMSLTDKVKYSKSSIRNALSNLTTRSTTTGQYMNAVWAPELGIFVAVSYIGTNRLAYSNDGIIWTDIVNTLINSYAIYSLCWSSELRMFVGYSSVGAFIISYDGLNWLLSNNVPEQNRFVSICWSPELNLFVAVSINGSSRVNISNNGFEWYSVNVSTTYSWNSVCWSNTLNLFVAASSTPNVGSIMYSSDGMIWTNATLPNAYGVYSVDWSKELNMFVAVCCGGSNNYPFLYSYDGINWTQNYIVTNAYYSIIKWISDLDIFIATTTLGTINIAYSFDGINWSNIPVPSSSEAVSSIMWSPELSMLIFTTNGSNTSTAIITSDIITSSSRSTIKSQANEFICDNINGRIGLGTQTPSYQLHLSSDNAAKPSTSTWNVSSDERLKENVQDADLNLCYNNIKNLRLVKYKWKDDVYTSDQVSDRSKLGWIAQEVETVFPKAVEKHNIHGYEDCRTLNNDQIIASMYGCTKQLINNYTNDNERFNILSKKILELETFINTLPDE